MRNQLLGNRYRILDRIGEGGMAYVYVAIDEKLGRRVAIKVLHEHMERNPDIRKRFRLEAQAVSALEHPNIVKIYDFAGDTADRLWIVTEVIKGKNLAQYVQQFTGGWLHPVVATCIVREVCRALAKAHAHMIVHRDIKPENIMVTHEGRVKLMDFGIAKDLGKTSMTLTGTFMGSPSYMSPEQIRGRDVDHRSDLYSLSVLFYEVVTGRLPFTGQTTHDVVMKIMEGGYTHPRYIVPSLPDRVNDAIVKGMAKDPAQRFPSASAYGAELDQQLKSAGFDESHVELERFFKDRAAFEARLARTKAGVLHSNTLAEKMRRDTQATLKLDPRTATGRRSRSSAGDGAAPTARLTSPFKVDEAWQRHMQQAQTPREPSRVAPPEARSTQDGGGRRTEGGGRTAAERTERTETRETSRQGSGRADAPRPREARQRTVPPPPQRLPRPPRAVRTRQPTEHPPAAGRADAAPAVRAASVYRPPRPAADPAGGRRLPALPARPMQRPRRRVARQVARVTIIRQSWLSYLFGVSLVGALAALTLWGFWELQMRLVSHPHGHALTREAARPAHGRQPHKPGKKRNGTPAEVRVITSSHGVLPGVPAPRHDAPRKGLGAPAVPAPSLVKAPAKKPPPRPAKPDTLARHDAAFGAGAAPVVVRLPSETPKDQNLVIETVELRKPRRPAVIMEDDDNASPAPAPAPTRRAERPAPNDAPAPRRADDGGDAAPRHAADDAAPRRAKDDAAARHDGSEAPAHRAADDAPAPAPAPAAKAAAKPDQEGDAAPTRAKSGKGKARFASQPAAEVYVDGRRVGTTVDATSSSDWVELPAGRHSVELRRQGYASFRSHFDLASDEQKSLPRVVLEAGGGDGAAQAGTTALTLRVSANPAQVTIKNLDTSSTEAFTMKDSARTVQLPPGHYQVRIERGGEVKEHELRLTGGEGQLTFTADFKDAE